MNSDGGFWNAFIVVEIIGFQKKQTTFKLNVG